VYDRDNSVGFKMTIRFCSTLLKTVLYCAAFGITTLNSQAHAQAPSRGASERPPVSVITAPVIQKPMPVRLDAIGTVQPMSSVTLRSRVDSQITEVAFEDGAKVKEGDVLFRLDARQIETQIRQAEANVARDRANLTLAEAELQRAEALARRDFGTEQRLDSTRSNVAALKAGIKANEAALDFLKVQQSYYTIKAPITGRIGVAGLKAGNNVRSGDNVNVLATLNQMTPIYVTFSLPQRHLPDVRKALEDTTAQVIATPQGYNEGVTGRIAVIDNTVDPLTGTLQIRAVFENNTDTLWPGALCQVRVLLRTEPDAVVIPRESVLSSQNGAIVFVVEGEGAQAIVKSRQITVNRTIDNEVVVSSGLKAGERVIVDGQGQLSEGARIIIRDTLKSTPTPTPTPSTGEPTSSTRSTAG
jgi:multidrug efflux system membrane fusion protein